MNTSNKITLKGIALRLIPGALTFCVALIFLLGIANPPKTHYLTNPPDLGKTVPIAQFEVSYFTYLSGITVAVIVTLVGIVFADKSFGEKRIAVGVGIVTLVLAMSLVTVGYMSRNIWVMSGNALSSNFTNIDFYILGPLTASFYVIDVWCLAEIAGHAIWGTSPKT